ncbi:helix-turn-helix domain-containing protein [Myxococcus guangdongensis]|uniref:helix-turn-helix domain-containing protein n=1 Tax=Myxococcus guangdongensis TaxID=2906760 RepID=UPI00389952CC
MWLVEHVAKALGRSESWVYKRVAEGVLPHTKRTGGLVFIPAHVMTWLTAEDDSPKASRRTTRAKSARSRA